MNNDVTRGNRQAFSNDDNDSHSLYQRVGVRTAYIFRLIKRQNPPPVAEAIAFGIYGNPLTIEDNGGSQDD